MIGIVLQARTGSCRLPAKVLKQIGTKNLLEHIFFRLQFLNHKAQIVLATTISKQDDILEDFCKSQNITCFRGSEDNVLERYYLCAKQNRFENIVRLTGDNPFVDIQELDNLIDAHLIQKADYTHSFGSLPIGVGAEIFTFNSLEKSYLNGKRKNHLEHVNEYIQENPNSFKIYQLKVPTDKNRPEIRLTVDTQDDYKKACFIVRKSKAEYITTQEAIELCLQYA